jgi:DNA segregation ATPase FtsK/SpoIIIE-like protein
MTPPKKIWIKEPRKKEKQSLKRKTKKHQKWPDIMSIYKNYSSEQLEELFSNYLIDSWSYSKLSTFARNEKAFEMAYLYNVSGKMSASAVAGQAYHKALQLFFNNLMTGESTDVIDLQNEAYDHISDVPANKWKIQKTNPTVDNCIQSAIEDSTKLINNFLSEVQIYLSEIKEVVHAEAKMTSWVTINGVDIPLPLHAVIDLVIITNDGKKVIIDHKSKTKFTSEEELAFLIGKQSITYVKAYEDQSEFKIDEVWFIENKIPKNRDNSPQLQCFKSVMDESTRRLYEAMLYEPLKRMIQAVNDPDYVYLINDTDNYNDRAELYEFWAKTMLAEISDFDIPEKRRPQIEARLRKIRDSSLANITPKVLKNFKKFTEQFIPYDFTNKDMTTQEKIEHVLRSFGIMAKVQHIFEGYSSTSFLLEINAGTSISQIGKYRLDIANALNVPNVRIQKDLYVYEGRSYLAVETGIKGSGILYWDESFLSESKIPIGKDNFGDVVFWDTNNPSTPHVIVCGATGSGKSVSLISTIEYAKSAGFDDVYIFDPKHEFKNYANRGCTVVNEIEDIEATMSLLVGEMQSRVKSQTKRKTLIVFDEFADAVANCRKGNELKIYENIQTGVGKWKRTCTGSENSLEENLRILLQKGRSCGMRIVAATQRASTKVITGDAKVNFPVQICFRVPKDIDSIVVIDEPGAESLNGRGDGLIKSPEYMGVVRFQAFYYNK